MTPPPQKFVEVSIEISNRICEAVGDANEAYPYTKWEQKYGKKVLCDVIADIVALALQTSHDEGVREGRQQERDLMKKFTEEIGK